MEEANGGVVLDGDPHAITDTDHLGYFTLLARVHYEGSLQQEWNRPSLHSKHAQQCTPINQLLSTTT